MQVFFACKIYIITFKNFCKQYYNKFIKSSIKELKLQHGVPLEIRTPDPLIKSQMLYRLS